MTSTLTSISHVEESLSGSGRGYPGYLTLQALATYSSCSVRWLRDRMRDAVSPLPYHRVAGKILIKREDFDLWMTQFRMRVAPDELTALVDGVVADVFNRRVS